MGSDPTPATRRSRRSLGSTRRSKSYLSTERHDTHESRPECLPRAPVAWLLPYGSRERDVHRHHAHEAEPDADEPGTVHGVEPVEEIAAGTSSRGCSPSGREDLDANAEREPSEEVETHPVNLSMRAADHGQPNR